MDINDNQCNNFGGKVVYKQKKNFNLTVKQYIIRNAQNLTI